MLMLKADGAISSLCGGSGRWSKSKAFLPAIFVMKRSSLANKPSIVSLFPLPSASRSSSIEIPTFYEHLYPISYIQLLADETPVGNHALFVID